MLTKSYKRKVRIQHSLLFVILMIIGLTMLVPFFWTLSSSFKYDREIFEYPIKWIPEVFRWSNYQEVWTRVNFLTYYLNTIKLSIIVTVGQVVTCSLAAYSFSAPSECSCSGSSCLVFRWNCLRRQGSTAAGN